MSEKTRDLFTIPNAVTLARIVVSPIIAKKLHDIPRKWWLPAAIIAGTDGIDGRVLAALGDNHPRLERLGFRRSETGKVLDHGGDKIVVPLFIAAGLKNKVIPKKVGAAALAQKAGISAYAVYAKSKGAEIDVTPLGQTAELVGNLGVGTFYSWESVDDPQTKQALRVASTAVAAVGIASAVAADIGYRRQVQQQLAEQ